MNIRSIIPSLLFTLVAVISYSIWAFCAPIFPSEPTMYAACAVVFLGFGGLAMLPESNIQAGSRLRFCLSFAGGFLLYAVIWSVAWFSLPNTFGEVIGSFFGLLAFTAVLRTTLKFPQPLMTATAVIFLWHTLGYYTGGFAYMSLQNKGPLGIMLNAEPSTVRLVARLSWGLFYGLGLGTGISRLLHLSRQS